MTKFRAFSLALTCLLAIGLASCAPTASPDAAPQETGVESPVPPQADLETPQPVQISIIDLLVDAPPEFLSGILALHNLPNDAQAVTADAFPTLAPSLRAYGLLPVMDEGTYVYRGSGNSYLPVLEQLPHPGGVALEQQGLNNGIVRYQGFAPDGRLIQQYLVTEVSCGEGNVCVAAISTHEKDAGVLYAVELIGETGEIVGVMPLVYKEVPRISDFGVSVGGNSLTMNEPPSYWMETANGEEALWRAPVTALSYEYENTVDAEVMTFQAGENVYSATHEQIYYNPEIGTYVANEDGVFVYDADSKAWYIPEQVVGAGESLTMTVGSRQVVQVGGELLEVEGTSEWKGQPVVQTEAGKMVWENGQWVELDQGIPLERLAGMSDDTKRLLAIEYAEQNLEGIEIVGEPRVEGNLVVWEQTEQYINERGSKDTREVIAGAWDLESGEWIERVTFDELPDLWDSMEDGEQVYFDGELLTMTTITDGPLIDAMNVVMSNGEHLGPNEVLALVDTNGEVKVVEFQYVPNNPVTEIMSVVKAEAGNEQTLYVVQPLRTEGKFAFDGKDPVTKAEISSWFPPLKRYGGNRVLNNAIDTAGSTFVLVTADPANYPGGWAGVRGDVARFTADGSHSFTADERGEADGKPVMLLTRLTKSEFLEKNKGFRIFVNWGNGESVGSDLMGTMMGGAQNPATVDNLAYGYTEYAHTGYLFLPHKHGLEWRVFK